MPTPRDYIGKRIRQLRRSKNMPGRDLAAAIGYSQSNISKIEKGLIKPNLSLIDEISVALRLNKNERSLLREQTRLFLDEYSKWSVDALSSISHAQKIVEARERNVVTHRCYEMTVIPGLLQTADYMECLFRALNLSDPDRLSEAIKNRQKRQKILARSNARFQFLIDERCLLPCYCDAPIMATQLDHLLALSHHKNISIRIIPFKARLISCPVTSFTMFDDLMVSVEALTHAFNLWTDSEVKEYLSVYLSLQDAALSAEKSRELIEREIGKVLR